MIHYYFLFALFCVRCLLFCIILAAPPTGALMLPAGGEEGKEAAGGMVLAVAGY
jgi:hypothetical protein